MGYLQVLHFDLCSVLAQRTIRYSLCYQRVQTFVEHWAFFFPHRINSAFSLTLKAHLTVLSTLWFVTSSQMNLYSSQAHVLCFFPCFSFLVLPVCTIIPFCSLIPVLSPGFSPSSTFVNIFLTFSKPVLCYCLLFMWVSWFLTYNVDLSMVEDFSSLSPPVSRKVQSTCELLELTLFIPSA